MSLVVFIMSLLSVLAPGYATEEVYQVLSDTSLVDIVVPEDAALFDLGVMPLDFTSTDSAYLKSIDSAVGSETSTITDGTVIGRLRFLGNVLDQVNAKFGSYPSGASLYSQLNSMVTFLTGSGSSTLTGKLGFTGSSSTYSGNLYTYLENRMLERLLTYIDNQGKTVSSAISSQTGSLSSIISSGNSLDSFLGVSSGKMLQSTGQPVNLPGVPTSVAEIERSGFLGLASLYRSVFQDKVFSATTSAGLQASTFAYTVGRGQQALYAYKPDEYLNRIGTVSVSSAPQSLTEVLRHGLLGLGRQLFDNQSSVAWNMWEYDENGNKVAGDWSGSSIADILTISFSRLSDPLADLAWVLANPADIELKEEANENTEAAGDAFVKPGGAGAPSVGDIGSMAGVSGSIKDGLQSGVTPSEGLSSVLDGTENYSFFSVEVADDLNRVHGPSSPKTVSDDGYIDFYDPDALSKFLGRVVD